MSSDKTITLAPEVAANSLSVRPFRAVSPESAFNFPTIADRYRPLEKIAEGGMGAILRAYDETLKREVALKVIHEKDADKPHILQRFLEESRITAQLQHPAIPPVHDLGTLPDGRPYLAMKLIKGQTLSDLLPTLTSIGQKLAIFESICQAIAYAHSKSVIHRDLKPANIMVGAFGETQVMDWGLAKIVTAESSAPTEPIEKSRGSILHNPRDSGETVIGNALGTYAYMPPEQAMGQVSLVGPASDVFGLGAILCELLTGQPPYVGTEQRPISKLAKTANLDDAQARIERSDVEPELKAITWKCLNPEPSLRYSNAGELAAAIAEYRDENEERARRAELERVKAEGEKIAAELRAIEQKKRRRVQLLLAAAIGVILIGGVAFGWYSERKADERTREHELAENEKKAKTLQRQFEDERRATAERERLRRNADAVSSLLGQCEEALRANDSAKADIILEAAEKREIEGGVEELADRFQSLKTDLAVLREMEAIDQFRWTAVDGRNPNQSELANQYKAALNLFGVNVDSVPTDDLLSRVSRSAIRERLIDALDRVLRTERKTATKALLRAIDPDPYRNAVRDATLARNRATIEKLLKQPAASEQSPEFVAFLGESPVVSAERKRELLLAALQRRPGNIVLLMAMGRTYPNKQKESADDRLRWYQAAVAVAPANSAAHIGLGLALESKGERDLALAEYTEAIRVNPMSASAHNNAGFEMRLLWDLDGAVAAGKEAIRLNPNSPIFHGNMGWILRLKGDLDGALIEFKESIRLNSKREAPHHGLGLVLQTKGDIDGAISEFNEALKLDPNRTDTKTSLAKAERKRELLSKLPDVLSGNYEPKTSAELSEFAELCLLPTQRRFRDAFRLYDKSFELEPKPPTISRFKAVIYLVRIAMGWDEDSAKFSRAERSEMRGKALRWLRANLILIKSDPTVNLAQRLSAWLSNPDLAKVRFGLGRIAMTAEERAEWDKLWAEVKATIEEARK